MIRLTLIAWLCLCSLGLADNGVPTAAKLEVERRGNYVEAVNGGVQATESPLLAEAMKPPADDSHKWFISVVKSKNCKFCKVLERDFAESDALRHWVNVSDHHESWAHWNVFQIEDQLQGWRFEKLKLTQYPTIIIQPPLDGSFGPSTDYLPPIVGYDGDAKKLSKLIRQRIGDYVEKFDGTHRASLSRFNQRSNRQPPVDVLPLDDESDDQSEKKTRRFQLPVIDNQNQEQSPMDPISNILLTLIAPLFGQFGLTGAVAAGFGIFLLIRQLRKQSGQKLLVSDEQVANFEKLIEQIISKKLGVQLPPPSVG